jgi:hypothetical protein
MPFVDVKVWASEAAFYREMMELLRVVYTLGRTATSTAAGSST